MVRPGLTTPPIFFGLLLVEIASNQYAMAVVKTEIGICIWGVMRIGAIKRNSKQWSDFAASLLKLMNGDTPDKTQHSLYKECSNSRTNGLTLTNALTRGLIRQCQECIECMQWVCYASRVKVRSIFIARYFFVNLGCGSSIPFSVIFQRFKI